MSEKEELEAIFYVDDSEIHGKGLYARVELEKGAFLGTYDGPEVEDNGMHVLWVEDDVGQWHGRDGKNLLRYLNHSETPLAAFDGFDLYALTEIAADAEVTIDYGEDFSAYCYECDSEQIESA